MKHPLFQSIQVKRPKTNLFDLSHEKKMSADMGNLIPILCQEVIPGDKFRVSTEIMMRMAPMIAPVMHRVNVFVHFFFVPNRLVYDGWQDFITGGPDGKTVTPFPYIVLDSTTDEYIQPGMLSDYLGVPPPSGAVTAKSTRVSALPFRGYQLIYNEYYRDQNLQEKVDFKTANVVDQDGDEVPEMLQLRKRCWEKDYFTSCLPWAQRGDDVLLPTVNEITYKNPATAYYGPGLTNPADADVIRTDATGNLRTGSLQTASLLENIDDISATTTINDFRRASRLQQWLERNARAGARYIEQIFAHFGVRSSDARLQRPEYLGGSKQPVVISEVLNHTGTEDLPQGNMAGHGISVGAGNGFNKFFEEHGYVFGIMSVLPRTAYQQGIDRSLTKFDKFDYAWPEFGNLGEQEVLNKEIYLDLVSSNPDYNDRLFGYQSRYSEYKFKQSSVHGDFRTNLNYWHMGRIFTELPGLNPEFVESNPTDRIFAVNDPAYGKLYIQLYNNVRAIRPLPMFGTPTL